MAQRSIGQSLQEYGRGIIGGLIFSLPLFYTGELWDRGATIGPQHLLAGLAATLLLLLGYNRFAGLRSDSSWLEVAIDSVEELAIGVALAAPLLWLVGAIDGQTPPAHAVGAILVEGMLAAIGVSIGTAQLGDIDDDEAGMDDGERPAGFVSRLALGACGAVLVAANMAPTDEIDEIAAAADAVHLAAIGLLSVGLGATALFFSKFKGSGDLPGWSGVVAQTASLWLTALAVSAALLWFFGKLDGQPPTSAAAQTIVLGLGATLGAAAGRMLLE